MMFLNIAFEVILAEGNFQSFSLVVIKWRTWRTFNQTQIFKSILDLIKKKSQKNLTNFHLLYYEII